MTQLIRSNLFFSLPAMALNFKGRCGKLYIVYKRLYIAVSITIIKAGLAMASFQRHENKIVVKLMSLLTAGVFLWTNVLYAEISCQNTKLRPALVSKDNLADRVSAYIAVSSKKEVKDKKIAVIKSKYFNWDREDILSPMSASQFGEGRTGIDRLGRLNKALKILKGQPQDSIKPIFSKDELISSVKNGFQLYKGSIIGKTYHDNVPGINLALFYSRRYMDISDYTRAFLIAHEFKHAIGGNEQDAYEIMVRFLVRQGIGVCEQIKDDIEKSLTGAGINGQNLILELVNSVIRELVSIQDEDEIIKNVKDHIKVLVEASNTLSAEIGTDIQYLYWRTPDGHVEWHAPASDFETRRFTHFIRPLLIVGLVAIVIIGGYLAFNPSKDVKAELAVLRSQKIVQNNSNDAKAQHKTEVEYYKNLQSNKENLLSQVETRYVEKFLSEGNRFQVIRFVSGKVNLEPELVAGFLYEEHLYGSNQNRLKAWMREMLSMKASLEGVNMGTLGKGQINETYIFDREILEFLYNNKVYFANVIKGRNDLEAFNGAMKYYSSHRESMGYMSSGMGWFLGMADIEEINIVFTAFAIRDIAEQIAYNNKGIDVIPDMQVMRKHSRYWMASSVYKDIPRNSKIGGDLLARWGVPFGNIKYYHPLMPYFALAQRYSGAKISYVRGLGKVQAYSGFLEWGGFKKEPSISSISEQVEGLKAMNVGL